MITLKSELSKFFFFFFFTSEGMWFKYRRNILNIFIKQRSSDFLTVPDNLQVYFLSD